MEQQKTNALLQMSAGRLQQAQAARQQATQSLIGGISGAAGLVGWCCYSRRKGSLGEGFREMAGNGKLTAPIMDKTSQTDLLKIINPMVGMDFSGQKITADTFKSTGNYTEYGN
jgi:hypothetical protein